MTTTELLAYSLDNILDDAQQARLDEALSKSEALQELRDELMAMRNLLKGHQLDARPDFVENIMAQLPQQEAVIREIALGSRVLKLFPRVAAACVLLMGLAYFGLGSNEGLWVSDTLIGMQELSPEDAYTYVNGDGFME